MLELKAQPFLRAIHGLATLNATIAAYRRAHPDAEDSELSPEHKRLVRRHLRSVATACGALSANICGGEALDLRKRVAGKNPLTYLTAAEEAGRLLRLLNREIEKSRLFAFEVENARYYDVATQVFGKEIDKFPRAVDDLEESGKCVAASRYTACVFHLMRAMEVIVQEIGKGIGLTNVDKRWGHLLSDISRLISKMPDGEQKELWNLARSNLWHVKEVWRNDTMHPKATYTGEQAREIVAAVKAFIRGLAGLMADSSEKQSC